MVNVLNLAELDHAHAEIREYDFFMPPKRVKKQGTIELNPCNFNKSEIPTLKEYLGKNLHGMFGYELEVEGQNLPDAPIDWIPHRDGSLRGESIEYVLDAPKDIEEIKKSFIKLVNVLTKKNTVLDFSFRTSTHVHLNVLDLNKFQIQSLFYLAHLVEEILVRYSGESRIGNRFCLRLGDAEYKINRFKKWLDARHCPSLLQEELKYSAINIATISTYGSIEFRSLRGTADSDVVFPWLDVIKNLYDIAKDVPISDIESVARDSPLEIANVVFKQHLPLFSYEGMVSDITKAYTNLIEIPYVKVKT